MEMFRNVGGLKNDEFVGIFFLFYVLFLVLSFSKLVLAPIPKKTLEKENLEIFVSSPARRGLIESFLLVIQKKSHN